MNFLKNLSNKATWLFAALAGLFYLLFKIEQSGKVDAEAKVEDAQAATQDAVLAEKQSEIETQKQQLNEAHKQEEQPVSSEELEEFLKKDV